MPHKPTETNDFPLPPGYSLPTFHIVLHEPEIPQNTGNIGRTCVAVGAKLWLVKPLGFVLEDRYLRRAGLDYWRHLDLEVVENWQTIESRLPARRWLFSRFAKRSPFDAEFALGDAFCFGSESRGLPRELVEAAGDFALRIPMREEVRSLNLSNTAAIIAYEALRQAARRAR